MRLSARPGIILLGALVALTGSAPLFAQQDSLNSLLGKFDRYRNETLQEKLFVHTDRSFYLTGETMWFKVYDVDGSFHMPLDVSKVVYLEILDQDNKAVLQTKIGMKEGGGGGTFFLPTSLSSGNYRLRAYTQWMRNFSPDFYFQQPITIVNPFSKAGLKPFESKPHYDVQFFPEGGHLVSGLKSTIGFRAVDQYGKGIDFYGTVLDEKNDTVARFQPLKFGLGNFGFVPLFTHRYKAVIKDKNGNTSAYPFPAVDNEGYVIHVQDSGANQVLVHVSCQFTNYPLGRGSRKPFVFFLAHTRQVIAEAKLHFLEQGEALFFLDKNKLGEGISHFTIFTAEMVPVCERLYFKQPFNKFDIEVQPDKTQCAQRKKIDLTLFARNQDGKPEELDLSVSVYKTDSLQNNNASNIVNYLWLTSELRGAIESPGYYLTEGSTKPEAVDNLMLTHGWSRFRWDDILKNKTNSFEFIPEFQGHIIHGRVVELNSGMPVKRITTYLATPGKNIRLSVSRSDDQGKVQYEMQDFVGSRRIIAQTNDQLDSTYRIEVTNPFSEAFSISPPGEFDLSEKHKAAITSRSFQMQIQNAFYDENPNHIAVPKIDSIAFYGKPDEQYWLDDFTRFPTMEEVMREYVPGVLVRKRRGKFHFMTLDRTNKTVFRNDPMVLLDGVPVFDIDKIMELDPRKVKKLDVLTQQYFLGPVSFDGLVSYTTYKGDLSDFQPNARALDLKYEGLQWKREFFVPRYESQDGQKSRIPDLRNLLYWSPNAKTNSQGKRQIDFYSSDVPGHYTVVVQGITSKGIPGVGTFTFTVSDHDQF